MAEQVEGLVDERDLFEQVIEVPCPPVTNAIA